MQFKFCFKLQLWVPIVFVLLLTACVSEECEVRTDPVLRVSFVKVNNGKEEAFTVAFKKISAKGTDSSFNGGETPLAGIRLPLDQQNNLTTFYFTKLDSTADTIELTYRAKPYFISQACGFEMKYDDIAVLSFTENNVDTIQVVQPSVNTNINDVNVKIYFKK